MRNLILVILVLLLGAFQCREDAPTAVNIRVVDQNGVAVDNARVILSCPSGSQKVENCSVKDTNYTNFLGESIFEFELPAVLAVSAFKATIVTVDTGFPPVTIELGSDSLCSEEFVTLKEHEMVNQTIIMVSCSEL